MSQHSRCSRRAKTHQKPERLELNNSVAMPDTLRFRPSPLTQSRRRALTNISTKTLVFLLLGLMSNSATFAWQTRPSVGDTSNNFPVAFERNARGDTSEVYRSDNDQVFLRVTLAPGFIKFSPNNCPTLQIDARVPVHHNETGPACTLTIDSANILLSTINDNSAISLPLHRLMNGSALAVRFVTSSGEYRESLFTLRNSKQAMKAAIGDAVRVEPKLASSEQSVDDNATPIDTSTQ